MNLKPQHRIARFDRYRGGLSTSCFLILIFNVGALAQSGRARTGSPTTTTTTTPTKTTTASDHASVSKPPKETKINLIAAKYVSAANASFQTGVAYRSFLARLQESGFLIVSSREDLRRKEAIDLAKSEENVYVAWLQLEVDLMGSSDARTDSEKATITPVNPACLFVTYAIFAPGGKVIMQGHTYQPGYQDRCAGTVYHPSPYPDRGLPTRTTPEFALKRAGSEAADRVMTSLDIPLPPTRP